MANVIYPKYKEKILQGDTYTQTDLILDTVKVALIDTGTYTYDAAHDFWDDASAAVVGTPQELSAGKSVTNGLFDSTTDPTFTAVTGNSIEALIIYIDSGTPATSPLVAYIDTGVTGLPVTPNGGDIDITWDAAGIFQL